MTIFRCIRLFALIGVFTCSVTTTASAGLLDNLKNLISGGDMNADYPATPLPCPGFGCYDAAITPSLNQLRKNIIGDHYKSRELTIGTMDGGTVLQHTGNVPIKSLVQYFEDVWWDKNFKLNLKISDQLAKIASLQMANANRMQDSGAIAQYQRDVNDKDVDIMLPIVGVQDAICDGPSMMQSDYYIRYNRKMLTAQSGRELDAKYSASAGAGASEGALESAWDNIDKRRRAKSCDPKGNNDANKAFCPEGSQPWDRLVESFLDATSYSDDPDAPNTAEHAKMFIENLMPGPVEPIRPDLLKPLSKEGTLLLDEQNKYISALNLFSLPLKRRDSELESIPDVKSEETLKNIALRAGLSEAVVKEVLSEKGVTAAGADEVIYSIFMRDPSAMIEKATWGGENTAKSQLIFMMNMIALLYDIRQEIKLTNIMLGGLGLQQSDDKLKELNAMTLSMSVKR